MSYRFALIGCGNIGARHAGQILLAGQLIAVCDTDQEKAAAFARKYGAAPYDQLSQLLASSDRPDVVVICTPNGLHARQAIEALQAGCHVLCEKPMCLSTDEGQAMIEAAAAAAKRLFVVKQNRFNPPVRMIKDLLDRGALGTVSGFQINCFWSRPDTYYNNSWRGTRLLDGGILYTQFSHFIDLLGWFLGDLREASGWRANVQHRHIIEFEDMGAAQLIMHQGAAGMLQYTVNAYGANMEGSFTLFGSRGTVKIGGQYLNRIDHFRVADMAAPEPEQGFAPNDYGFYQGSMSNHDIVYRELIRTLDDPGHPFVEASEALRSVSIIERIYAASPFVQIGPAHG